MTIDEQKKLDNILKVVREQSYQCMCPECTQDAINSHYLQRHGVLNRISKNNNFWELKHKPPFYWTDSIYAYEFKKCGINNAFSIPTFCEKHDNELFNFFENGKLDCDDY